MATSWRVPIVQIRGSEFTVPLCHVSVEWIDQYPLRPVATAHDFLDTQELLQEASCRSYNFCRESCAVSSAEQGWERATGVRGMHARAQQYQCW